MLSKKIAAMLLLMITLSFPFPGGGVALGENGKAESPVEEKDRAPSSIATLNNIVLFLGEKKRTVRLKQKELKRVRTPDEKNELTGEIEKLIKEIHSLEASFRELATGIDPGTLDKKTQNRFDWKREIEDLFKPIVLELKSATEKPRQMEKIRSRVFDNEARLPILEKALSHVRGHMGEAKSKKLKTSLKELESDLSKRMEETNNNLEIARFQLEEIARQKRPLVESIRNLIRVFFKERGRNLMVALLTFVAVFLVLRLIHRQIHRALPRHVSPKHPFFTRIFDLVFHVTTFAGAVCGSLIMLYISGDWVLLSVVIIFLFGLSWAAKQGLPQFWNQTRMLLNLGPVRENERVIYKGLPWRVSTLNLYTRLKNPMLKHVSLRLPLQELAELNSYPHKEDDPWFPTRVGDWVILSDGTRGKVVHQTHEMVQLVLRGGSRKTYPTDSFLSLCPLNLSVGFRLKVTLGLDYNLQDRITGEIPNTLATAVEEGLVAAGYQEDLQSVKVDFSAAAASSLDLLIICDFKGAEAIYYGKLERLIQALAVETATKHNWNIPFTQVVVHTGE